MFKITIRNTSGKDIGVPGLPEDGCIRLSRIYANSEWEFCMGKITKRLLVECPNPKCTSKKMAIPHVDNYQDLIGCVIGCSGCGSHLICVPPGKLEIFDDTLHKATKDLPKGDA